MRSWLREASLASALISVRTSLVVYAGFCRCPMATSYAASSRVCWQMVCNHCVYVYVCICVSMCAYVYVSMCVCVSGDICT